MSRYAISASYVPEHWDRLIAHPAASTAGFRRIVESLGATLESFDYTLGDSDLLAIIDAPDPTTQVAVSVGLAATNVFKAVVTRELVAPDVIVAALLMLQAGRNGDPGAEDGPAPS